MKTRKHSLKKDFLTGLFLILPIGISIWILIKIFSLLDSILADAVFLVLGMRIPGLGMILTIIIIFVIGFIANRILGKKIVNKIENMFESLPLIKKIYKPIRNVLSKFSNKSNDNFKQVVLVNFPNTEGKSIGFITNDNIHVEDEEKIFVFVPTTPNPTNGFLMLYDKEDVVMLNIPVEQALSMVISLGSSFEGTLRQGRTEEV